MSRNFPKRIKRRLESAKAQRALLMNLVKAHEQWEKDREEEFREIPSYDPVDGDQPCSDKDMGDYDEMEDRFAYDAQESWTEFADQARKLLGMTVRDPKLKPFTVVKDWNPEVWDEVGASESEAQLFHVWAESNDDAVDEAEELAVTRLGSMASHLHSVAVLAGHAKFGGTN